MSTHSLTSRWHDLDRETRLELQGHKLHHYLRDCVLPFSKHYSRMFDDLGLSAEHFQSVEDLQDLPFTSKEDLLPTPENPQRALGFALIPDPHQLARRPRVIARALLRGKTSVK